MDFDNLTIVQVIWDDAEACNIWRDIEDACNIKRCKTIGYLIGEDDKQIKVANTMASDKDISGDWAIPKGMIVEIKKFKIK